MTRTSVATARRFGTLEVLGLILLVAAWPVGAILLWVSKTWTTREKLLGTFMAQNIVRILNAQSAAESELTRASQ